jgi:predicted O-methyltransferase YrrM
MAEIKFEGVHYRLADNWFPIIPVEDKPINYLEIGAFYGANAISVCQTYAHHKDSKVYVIDPWEDYEEYPEYKGMQRSILNTFAKNIEPFIEKVIVNRGYSHQRVPNLKDDFFDMIYIDGNHNPEYIIEDAVICFRKLKVGGWLIFDDYGWCDASRGIDAFLNAYYKRIKCFGERNTQVFCQKLC